MAKVFIDGLIFKKPREGAPDFVHGSLSVKVQEFTKFCEQHQKNGWVNIDILKSKEKGTTYLALNNWEPKKETESKDRDWNGPVVDDYNKITDIPF